LNDEDLSGPRPSTAALATICSVINDDGSWEGIPVGGNCNCWACRPDRNAEPEFFHRHVDFFFDVFGEVKSKGDVFGVFSEGFRYRYVIFVFGAGIEGKPEGREQE